MTSEIQILLALLLAAGIGIFIFWIRKQLAGAGPQPRPSTPGAHPDEEGAVQIPGGDSKETRTAPVTAEEDRLGIEEPESHVGCGSSLATAEGSTCPPQELVEEEVPAEIATGAGPDGTGTAVAEESTTAQAERPLKEPATEGPAAEEDALGGAATIPAESTENIERVLEEPNAAAVTGTTPPTERIEGVLEEPPVAEAREAEPTEKDAVEAAAIPAKPGREQPAETAGNDALRDYRKRSRKKPRKYAGLLRKPPEPQPIDVQGPRGESEAPTRQDRSFPIEVRLLFERGGSCTVSLIARRAPGLPEDLTVAAQSGPVHLRAMQDEWYQDVIPEDIARLLREGTVWNQAGDNGQCSWLLSGRELYVFAARTDLRGYVSQACLELEREQAVLCSERIRSSVEEAIRATGAEPTAVLDASLGAPPGWVVFRDVVPRRAVEPAGEADILNALRPLPKIDISLEGGIRLEYATWLAGFPPTIRVYGDPEHTSELLIDGRATQCQRDGTYHVPGSNTVGTHTIWCGGTSKSYSLVPFTASWNLWDAYSFPVDVGSNRCLSICGPLVNEVSESECRGPSLQVPHTHPVVLGSTPGEYVLGTRASEIPGIPRIASPHFRPIWALPLDPLHCSKETRILLVGEAAEPTPPGHHNLEPLSRAAEVRTWCRLILDAGRKGLSTEPDSESVRNLWLAYKRLARRIWRAKK